MKRLTLLTTAALAIWFGGRQSGKQAAINELQQQSTAKVKAVDDTGPDADEGAAGAEMSKSDSLDGVSNDVRPIEVAAASGSQQTDAVSAVAGESMTDDGAASDLLGGAIPVFAESADEMTESKVDPANAEAELDEDIIVGLIDYSTSDNQLSWHLRDLENQLSSDDD